MKKILLLTCMLWGTIAASASETKSKDPIHVLSTRMDVLYFKVDKEFIGGEIEIYSQDGIKLLSQKVVRRKVLIDFYYENPGKYIVHFSKGEVQKDVNFVKNEPCPEPNGINEKIKIMQGV